MGKKSLNWFCLIVYFQVIWYKWNSSSRYLNFNPAMEPPQQDLLMSTKHPSSEENPPSNEIMTIVPSPSSPQKSDTSPAKRKKRMMNLKSHYDIPMLLRSESVIMDNFHKIMANNRIWAKVMVEEDPNFFEDLADVHKPEYLWIGCSDSRVPANQILGLQAGEVFVHRNIANQAPPSDINVLAVVQYAVEVLKVTDIMVTGHYGCGGIKAAFDLKDHGPLESWLSYIRDLRWRYRRDLILPTGKQNEDLLCELNVKQQVYNVGKFSMVQNAWREGQQLRIHGLIYSLKDGLLKDLGITLSKLDHLPQQFRIV